MRDLRFHRVISGLLLWMLLVAPVQGAFLPNGAPQVPAQRSAAPPPQTAEGVIEIPASSFDLPLSSDPAAQEYDGPAISLEQGDSLRVTVDVPSAGPYWIAFDMAAAEGFIQAPEGSLTIDGEYPVADARRIVLPIFYQNSADAFPLDRYGNDALIRQQRLVRWSKAYLRDANFSLAYPVAVEIAPGEHELEFTVDKGSLYLGSIYLEPVREYPSYAEYLQQHQAPEPTDVMIQMEAEFPAFKNNTAIRPISERSLEVTPYDTYRLLLNTIGGASWDISGSALFYEVTVPQDGLYAITLRAKQNVKDNLTTFRRVTINGEVPFAELNQVPFASSKNWQNITLGGETPYKIFLRQGVNLIGLEATNAPYLRPIEKIQKVLLDINTLSLEIKKLTGNQVDQFKEWEITEYIPDISERLQAIADDLSTDVGVLLEINKTGGSQEVLAYQMAIDNITSLAQEPNEIPTRLNRFSEGSGSSAQRLGTILPSLQEQPLALDKVYVHSTNTVPLEASAPFTTRLVDGIRRFFASFASNPYYSVGAEEDELEVWVNRPRQYVDLLQSIADNSFTTDTGIRVKFSIMPNESKLVLANAADIQPDVALGVSTNIPYELAVRNALLDLRQFEDFDEYIHIYSPGALLSYIINDSVYALPETQDFWVTYYRRDIMESLGIPIPKTWNEVIEILPELQRYGMNYNTPLSSGSGLKGYLATAPYLFNHGAQLYAPDGFSTGLESEEAIEAMKFMSESFTIYAMPLTTANFYDSFRYGSLPIGISNFETYIKLVNAAPEIRGLWGIDLYPATVMPDGTENRWATGSAQASIVFKATDRPEDSWEFLKWWMSTETQVEFQEQLVLNYGLEYLWNSANLEAFAASPMEAEHKAVVLEQWQWLQEPIKLPGSYMQEREISNAWNRIVFDDVNPRIAIDESITIINREITRKMEEFGYLQNGVRVKEFKVPTIETVERWMAGDE